MRRSITKADGYVNLTVSGMDWLRVYSACQALMAPTGTYHMTYKRCREVIRDVLGFCPKGKPGEPLREGSKLRKGGVEAIHAWLGLVGLEHHRRDLFSVGQGDVTHLSFVGPKGGVCFQGEGPMRFTKTAPNTWSSACGFWIIERRPCFCPFVAFHNGSRVVQTPTLSSTKRAIKDHLAGRAKLNREDEPTEVVLTPEAFDRP